MDADLSWQLIIDGHNVSGGNFLPIQSCRLVDNDVIIDLKSEQSGRSNSFLVHSNINVGGKNHLLLSNSAHAQTTRIALVVVRLFDGQRVCAMDADRFSSLRNALQSFVEAGEFTPSVKLLSLCS